MEGARKSGCSCGSRGGGALANPAPRREERRAGEFRHGEWRGQPECGVLIAADPMMSDLWGT